MSKGMILGDLPATCGHDANYWRDRDCFVDARGPLVIHPGSFFGYQVMLLTLSHDVSGGQFVAGSPCVGRGVQVDEGAFVCSRASLYNCHIGHHAIVAFGGVVRSQEVPPRVIVADLAVGRAASSFSTASAVTAARSGALGASTPK